MEARPALHCSEAACDHDQTCELQRGDLPEDTSPWHTILQWLLQLGNSLHGMRFGSQLCSVMTEQPEDIEPLCTLDNHVLPTGCAPAQQAAQLPAAEYICR
jgi:hypothetical protein